ncbi:MAG: tetratricopeptide repeat-containing protein kinase family protein [Acidobacteriota bacterium]
MPETEGNSGAFDNALMTLAYASPEQVRGEPPATSTDIYSLGVVLFQVLTSRLPIETAYRPFLESARAVCDEAPPLASRVVERSNTQHGPVQKIPPEIDHIIDRALDKDPQRRYASVERLQDDIQNYLDGFPVSAFPGSPLYPLVKLIRRQWPAVIALSLIATFLVVMTFQRFSIDRERSRAEAINDFMTQSLSSPDPFNSMGYQVTVAEVLEKAVERIPKDFEDRPDIAASLQLLVGSVYARLGLLDEFGPLLDRALAGHRAFFGERHRMTSIALNELGYLLDLEGNHAEARRVLQEGLDIDVAKWAPVILIR